MKTVEIVLVAVGGYGRLFLDQLLEKGKERKANIAGIVQTNITKYPELALLLKEKKIPVYESLEHFYAERKADLAVIASPMQHHSRQTCLALENGSNVLCEKPACSSVREVVLMEETAIKTGKFIAVGYQLSFNTSMLELKEDILAGLFGKPLTLKALLLRPRSDKYYSRNSWAGKKFNGEGRCVFDSVAHNAGSHNIHNMLFLLGKKLDASAEPISVAAELYRANAIENYDTAAARIVTGNGAEILFFGSHAVFGTSAKKFEYRFEKGIVYYDPDVDKDLLAVMSDGSRKNYGDPEVMPEKKLWTCVQAVQGEAAIPCGIAAAMAEVLCIEGMQDSTPEINEFPGDSVAVGSSPGTDEKFVYVKELDEIMRDCFEKEILPT
ncbi:MAG: Gfo/Idh/MocA family oxidoreductase, partial [Treponemataceae bacterium]